MNGIETKYIQFLLERVLERMGDDLTVIEEEWKALQETEAFDRSRGVLISEYDWKALNAEWDLR